MQLKIVLIYVTYCLKKPYIVARTLFEIQIEHVINQQETKEFLRAILNFPGENFKIEKVLHHLRA